MRVNQFGSLSSVLHLGDYQQTLCGVVADLIFTSPPYNIGSRAPKRDGFRKHGKYDPKSFGAVDGYPDALPEKEYQNQQARFLIWCAAHLAPGGTVVYNHKPRTKNKIGIHPAEWFLRPAVKQVLTFYQEVVWDRGSTHNHCPQLMWPQTERLYIFYHTKGTYAVNDNRKKSDLWKIHRSGPSQHCAPFSLELARAVVETFSKPGQLVCDPYSGSGTTAIVCAKLGRRFEGSEILPKYHELAMDSIMEVVA